MSLKNYFDSGQSIGRHSLTMGIEKRSESSDLAMRLMLEQNMDSKRELTEKIEVLKHSLQRITTDEDIIRTKHNDCKLELQESWDKLVRLQSYMHDHQTLLENITIEILEDEARKHPIADGLDIYGNGETSTSVDDLTMQSAGRYCQVQDLRDMVRRRAAMRSQLSLLEESQASLRKKLAAKSYELQQLRPSLSKELSFVGISSLSTASSVSSFSSSSSSSSNAVAIKKGMLELSAELDEVQLKYVSVESELSKIEKDINTIMKWAAEEQEPLSHSDLSLSLPSSSSFNASSYRAETLHMDDLDVNILGGLDADMLVAMRDGKNCVKGVIVDLSEGGKEQLRNLTKTSYTLDDVLGGQAKILRLNGESAVSFKVRLERKIQCLKVLETELNADLEGRHAAVNTLREEMKEVEFRRLRIESQMYKIMDQLRQQDEALTSSAPSVIFDSPITEREKHFQKNGDNDKHNENNNDKYPMYMKASRALELSQQYYPPNLGPPIVSRSSLLLQHHVNGDYRDISYLQDISHEQYNPKIAYYNTKLASNEQFNPKTASPDSLYSNDDMSDITSVASAYRSSRALSPSPWSKYSTKQALQEGSLVASWKSPPQDQLPVRPRSTFTPVGPSPIRYSSGSSHKYDENPSPHKSIAQEGKENEIEVMQRTVDQQKKELMRTEGSRLSYGANRNVDKLIARLDQHSKSIEQLELAKEALLASAGKATESNSVQSDHTHQRDQRGHDDKADLQSTDEPTAKSVKGGHTAAVDKEIVDSKAVDGKTDDALNPKQHYQDLLEYHQQQLHRLQKMRTEWEKDGDNTNGYEVRVSPKKTAVSTDSSSHTISLTAPSPPSSSSPLLVHRNVDGISETSSNWTKSSAINLSERKIERGHLEKSTSSDRRAGRANESVALEVHFAEDPYVHHFTDSHAQETVDDQVFSPDSVNSSILRNTYTSSNSSPDYSHILSPTPSDSTDSVHDLLHRVKYRTSTQQQSLDRVASVSSTRERKSTKNGNGNNSNNGTAPHGAPRPRQVWSPSPKDIGEKLSGNNTTNTTKKLHSSVQSSIDAYGSSRSISSNSSKSDCSIRSSQLWSIKDVDEILPVQLKHPKNYDKLGQMKGKKRGQEGNDGTDVGDESVLLQLKEQLQVLQCRLSESQSAEKPSADRQNSGYLEICVLHARNLPEMKRISKSCDAYVTLSLVESLEPVQNTQSDRLDSSQYSTSVFPNSCFPQWRHHFHMSPVKNLKQVLLLQVLDSMRLPPDEVIGYTFLPLSMLTDQAKHSYWLQLKPPLSRLQMKRMPRMPDKCSVKVEARLTYSRKEMMVSKIQELKSRIYQLEHNGQSKPLKVDNGTTSPSPSRPNHTENTKSRWAMVDAVKVEKWEKTQRTKLSSPNPSSGRWSDRSDRSDRASNQQKNTNSKEIDSENDGTLSRTGHVTSHTCSSSGSSSSSSSSSGSSSSGGGGGGGGGGDDYDDDDDDDDDGHDIEVYNTLSAPFDFQHTGDGSLSPAFSLSPSPPNAVTNTVIATSPHSGESLLKNNSLHASLSSLEPAQIPPTPISTASTPMSMSESTSTIVSTTVAIGSNVDAPPSSDPENSVQAFFQNLQQSSNPHVSGVGNLVPRRKSGISTFM